MSPGIVARLRAAGSVFAEDEARLLTSAAALPAELAALVDRRVAGEPIEYILGWAQFCGLRIAVDPGVFVPRRRTEFLAEQAAELVPEPGIAVELCCGTGAVGRVLARRGRIELHGVDIDPVAVRCARRNLAPVGARVYEGDLYEPLPAQLRGQVDVLVANAPYVPTEAIGLMPPEARDYEARAALDGGSDGLDVQRRVAAGAARWLAPGGHLLIETSEGQAPELAAVVASSGLVPQVLTCADRDATIVLGSMSADRRGPTPAG